MREVATAAKNSAIKRYNAEPPNRSAAFDAYPIIPQMPHKPAAAKTTMLSRNFNKSTVNAAAAVGNKMPLKRILLITYPSTEEAM